MRPIRIWVLGLLTGAATACQTTQISYRDVAVEAPFDMPVIREVCFPDRDFVLTDYGAATDGQTPCTEAFAAAIEACNAAGGGRVVVPAGEWYTGPIHLRSNVDLHLSEGSVVRFTDNPDDYLPAVMTSWEGLECYNYSPLVYAFDCENIAITGSGTLAPRMDTWRGWFGRPDPHLEALRQLYTQASTDAPVEERQMAVGENHLRPHLIHLNRCRNILLDGFRIRESPFWTIHVYLCENGIARNLDVYAHGHNNDGIDLEMTRNFLVEDCTFDQGDDAVVIKAGRNRDAWRLDTPCENIVVRNCRIVHGHTLLGVGSEISGGIRNVYMHHCTVDDNVLRVFFIKTNHRRGGFIENVWMDSVRVGNALRMLEIDTDVLYQWKDLVPTYETAITRIENIYMDRVQCDTTRAMIDLKGDARLPVRNVAVRGLHAKVVTDFVAFDEHVEGLVTEAIEYDRLIPEQE